MHISESILPAKLLITGYGITGLATWYSLRQIHQQADPTIGIPKASLLTAAFFVASSLHIPIPPASVHFVLNGLLGTILGNYAFPAILVGLFLQAVMLGHGGLTTLGVNGVIMGIPALISGMIFQHRRRWYGRLGKSGATRIFAFLAGGAGVGISACLFWGLVITNLPTNFDASTEKLTVSLLLSAHIPLVILEGIFTAMVVSFLQKTKPELLSEVVNHHEF